MHIYKYSTSWGRLVVLGDEPERIRRYGVVSGLALFRQVIGCLIDRGAVEKVPLYPN